MTLTWFCRGTSRRLPSARTAVHCQLFKIKLSGNLSLIQANVRLSDDSTKLRVNSNPALPRRPRTSKKKKLPRRPKAPIPLALKPTLRLLGTSYTSYFFFSLCNTLLRKTNIKTKIKHSCGNYSSRVGASRSAVTRSGSLSLSNTLSHALSLTHSHTLSHSQLSCERRRLHCCSS